MEQKTGSVQQTSLDAYESIRQTLGERQRQVLIGLMSLGEATNKMIERASGIPINCVTARIFELRQMGKVVESYVDKCPITGRKAIFWRVFPQETKVVNNDKSKTLSTSASSGKKGGMYVCK